MFAFKKFSFFTQVEVKLHSFPANATCHCVGPQQLFVGCDNGSIHVLDDTCQSQGAFSGFGHKVLFLAYAKVRSRSAVLVYSHNSSTSSSGLYAWFTRQQP